MKLPALSRAPELDWVAQPQKPARVGLIKRLILAALALLPKGVTEGRPACPVCLQTLRPSATKCSHCGLLLVVDDPLAALAELQIEWPAADVTIEESLPEGFGAIDPERLRLREMAEEILSSVDSSQAVLRCLRHPHTFENIQRYPHQIATVQRVLGDMEGRALLADEVGLGKTIEAGLVLAEMRERGTCQRALLLTPPSLVSQWRGDLSEKLGLPVTIIDEPGQLTDTPEIGLMSIYTAKGSRLSSAVLKQNWDLVIIDEAHRLRNHDTQIHRFARGLRSRGLLLLSATPVHDSVRDLHTLVSLVKPGLLGDYARFRSGFGVSVENGTIRDSRRLQGTLRTAMIRNRRATAGIDLPPRHAAIQWVTLSEAERSLYQSFTNQLRREVAGGKRVNVARAGESQRRLTSTPQAARAAAAWVGDPAVRANLESILDEISAGEKIWALQKLCLLYPDDQLLVFSEFRETVDAIAANLEEAGEKVVHWHGGMSASSREAALSGFRAGETRILVGTDALAEGQNLQNSRIVINFDLPWNPFQIEQRIGRVHRLGQSREVFIISLVAKDSFEADLAQLLARKLHLFELSVGELDPILGELIHSEDDFEDFLTRIALADDEARERNLSDFSKSLADAYMRNRELQKQQDVLPDLSPQGGQ